MVYNIHILYTCLFHIWVIILYHVAVYAHSIYARMSIAYVNNVIRISVAKN